MPKLTEPYIAALVVPEGKNEILVFDDQLPGFGIRKLKSGRATYFVKYRIGHQQRKVTLGTATAGTLARMRQKGHEVLSRARLGHDTSGELKGLKADRPITIGALVPEYLAACRPKHKPRSFEEKNRHLTKHWFGLHALPVNSLTRGRIVTDLDKIVQASGPVAADRSKASLSSFLAWCIEKSHIDSNPVAGISRRSPNDDRDRVLSEHELVAIWRATDDETDYARIVRFLLLTGQRREEIGGLLWREIDFDRREILLPPPRTKNKRPHVIPLSDAAMTILKSANQIAGREHVFGIGGGGFSGWSRSKIRLDERLGETVAEWRLHDLRRTCSTMLGDNGFALPHVIEAILNHISGTKANVAGIYNRALYLPERRQALDQWANHVLGLVAGSFPARQA